MIDADDLLLRPLLHGIAAVLRFVLWLAWDFFVETIGWYVGWPICRALSLGRFPDTGIHDMDVTAGWAVAIVYLVGLGSIAALAFALALW